MHGDLVDLIGEINGWHRHGEGMMVDGDMTVRVE